MMTQQPLRTCVTCGRMTDHEIVFTVPTFGKVTLPICDRSCGDRVFLKTDPFAPGHLRLQVAPDPDEERRSLEARITALEEQDAADA